MTDYIFAAGYGFNTVAKYTTDLVKVGESADYGGTIVSLVNDGDYIYAGGYLTNKIYKYRKSDLTKVDESASYGGTIEVMCVDDTYIYVGGQTTQKVYKYSKADLTKVAESGSYGGTIRAILVDDDYVFAGGYDTTQKLYKYDKTDLSKLAESADYGGIIRAIADDATYIYMGGFDGATQKVYKLAKSDLAKAAESTAVAGLVRAIVENTSYIYVGGYTDEKIYKLNKSDLTAAASSAATGSIIEAFTEDTNNLYLGGLTSQGVQKYLKSDLSFVAESSAYGGAIYSIALGASSVITDVISVAKPISLTTTKEINGIWSAKMQILPDDYIGSENYVEFDDQYWIVKSLKKIKSNGKYYYDVSLEHNMTELADLTIERFSYLKTVTALLTLLLSGTGWTAGTVDLGDTVSLVSDRRISVLEALNMLADKCTGELYFNSKTRIVDIKRTIGTVTGLQLRYDKNCDYIEKEEDSTNLVTRIYPLGPDNFTINTTTLDNCEDETLYTGSGSATLAASTIKQNGSQAIEVTYTALNETAIRDLGAGGVKDLTGHDSLKFWIYSATTNASGYTFGIGESAYTEITTNTGALTGGNWHEITLDLSGTAASAKNAIRYIGFKNLTSGASVVVFDNIRAFSGVTYIDSDTRTLYKVNKEYAFFHSAKPEVTSTELILYPTDDAYVYEGAGNTNYGSAAVLKITDNTPVSYESYVKFSLDQIPAGATITGADLSLTCAAIISGGHSGIEARVATEDWSEDTLTYNIKPGGTVVAATFDMTSTGLKTESMTSTVQDWFDGTTPNYGLRIKAESDPDNASGADWYSKENADNKPYLTITYTLTTDPSPIIEAAARKYLYDHDEPILKYKVKAVDLSQAMANTWEDETIDLGDTCRIYDADLGINVDVRIKKITKDILNPENITLELGNKADTIVTAQANVLKQLAYAMPYQDNSKIVDANAIQTGYLGSDVNV